MTSAARNMRPRAVSGRTLGRRELERSGLVDRETLALAYQWRPRTRAHCASVPRPCPYVSCSHNLYLDVTDSGGIKFNFPDLEPDELPANASCALDIAERGGVTEEELVPLLNIVRTRVQQLTEQASRKLRRLPLVREMGK